MTFPNIPNALIWLQNRTTKPNSKFWFLFLIGFPVISHIVGRILKQKWWLNDFDALICGADYLRRGLSPYSYQPVCEGLKPAPYVYAPQVGKGLVPVIETFGLIGTKALYAGFLVPALALIIWYALKRPFANLPLHLRIIGYTVISGSALTCGNIVIIFHAAALWAGLNLNRARWPFLLVILAGSLIKPVFLTYLIVLIYQDKPFRERVGLAALGAGLGIGAYLWILKTAGPLLPVWQKTIYDITLIEQPGYTFFSWADWIGMTALDPTTLTGFGIYFIILSLCGLLICEIGKLSTEMRLLIGLGMAQLINPRMMSYDMIYLPTMVAGVVMVTQALNGQVFWRTSWTLALIGGFSLILANLPVAGLKPADIVSPLFVAIIIYVTFEMVWAHRTTIRSQIASPKRLLGNILDGRV